MSIIGWNCRGLGNPSAVTHLKYLICKYKSDVMILYETLINSNRTNELRQVLGFDSCFAVDREGRGGGVAVFWKNELGCTITNFSTNHVDIDIADSIRGNWRLTRFYGYPEGSRRRDSWNLLKTLSRRSNLPWCVIGDFNDILSSDEKKGRTDRANWLIRGFREAVLDAGLVDLVMHDYQFTWFKSLGTNRAVEEKLDRALASNTWHYMFPHARLECLTATSSDHYPLWLTCNPTQAAHYSTRHFKFENAWLFDPTFDEYVRQNWSDFNTNDIMSKLGSCALDLTQWSKTNFHNLRKEIDTCHKKLELVRGNIDESNINYFNALKRRLSVLLTQDDRFWRQRAKAFCARESVLCAITSSVTNDDNDKLLAPFVIEEFKEAVFSMQADKCPGPDGFNSGFYQHFWDLCGHEIFTAGCSWLDSGIFPPNLNSTNIALIPKGDVQTTMKDWRPITLCNVLYKVVAKVLANRLKGVLTKCISDNQSAFVPGRSILDNAMAAIELVHYMKSKTRGKQGEVALKLDISKAYD
ncbi:endonuclease/exonuclease/phosphatase family protein, partial [Trifolium medium]|nr:endonuclease/exonuclease/phosphatase family protein [Trifolium medium]